VLLPLYHARQEETDGSGSWVSATTRAACAWHGEKGGSARVREALCAWHIATERALLAAHGDRLAPHQECSEQEVGDRVNPSLAPKSEESADHQRISVPS
jgi:hypothetical protein